MDSWNIEERFSWNQLCIAVRHNGEFDQADKAPVRGMYQMNGWGAQLSQVIPKRVLHGWLHATYNNGT